MATRHRDATAASFFRLITATYRWEFFFFFAFCFIGGRQTIISVTYLYLLDWRGSARKKSTALNSRQFPFLLNTFHLWTCFFNIFSNVT